MSDTVDYHAQNLAQSREAVALIGKPQTCPTCLGNKRLGSFWCGILARSYDCPTCNGTGKVTTPCPVEDYNGGWNCCPICFAGQNKSETEPCPHCLEVLANENVGKNALALATQAAKAMGDYRKVQRAIYARKEDKP